MPFWPFQKRKPESLTPHQLREKLISVAASGSQRKLRAVCREYQQQVADQLDVIARVPEGMPSDNALIDSYFQCLGAVARCLAEECGAPELWNRLNGDADSNPLIKWEQWYVEFPERMQQLQHAALIDEARAFIEMSKQYHGAAARQHEAFLNGRLGEALFHSGGAATSMRPFQAVLELCQEIGDLDGQVTYLNNLLEVHCYLDDGGVLQAAQRVLEFSEQHNLATDAIQRRVRLLKQDVPPCRVICLRNDVESELEEITEVGQGSYQFLFRRSRPSLQMATRLTAQGNQRASAGELSDALTKYHDASEIDPHDPDPVYQSGMCLLELGAYDQAKHAFEEVERLAPGWFHCRTHRWMADGLERGTLADEAVRLLRALEDGNLKAAEAMPLTEQAVEHFSEFAPLYLVLGDLYRARQDDPNAITAYRQGLEVANEPDLESRLALVLAGTLPADSPERDMLLRRVVELDGNLVASATARLLLL